MDQNYEKRDNDIRGWRRDNVPQTKMAQRLGITRQRVQQIERRLGLGLRRVPGVYKKYTFKCAYCNKEVSLKLAGRVYCSRECFFMSRKVARTSEEERSRLEKRKQKNRDRSKSYYYDVFKKRSDWRSVVKQRNEKYAKKKK